MVRSSPGYRDRSYGMSDRAVSMSLHVAGATGGASPVVAFGPEECVEERVISSVSEDSVSKFKPCISREGGADAEGTVCLTADHYVTRD